MKKPVLCFPGALFQSNQSRHDMTNKNKYIATATRKNVDGKPDYRWIFKHSNGLPVLFDSPEKALNCAIAKCADSSHSLYNPKFEMV